MNLVIPASARWALIQSLNATQTASKVLLAAGRAGDAGVGVVLESVWVARALAATLHLTAKRLPVEHRDVLVPLLAELATQREALEAAQRHGGDLEAPDNGAWTAGL